MSVPPLNSNLPRVLVNPDRSPSIKPALSTLVPRRTSNVPVPKALDAHSVPPSTTTRLLVEKAVFPTVTLSLAATVPPLETTNCLRGPDTPTTSVVSLLHNEPEPVTTRSEEHTSELQSRGLIS